MNTISYPIIQFLIQFLNKIELAIKEVGFHKSPDRNSKELSI